MMEVKHRKALTDLYKSHGVGRLINQRFKFWESQHPDGYSISHNPTEKMSVAVFEMSWLVDQARFNKDFVVC